MSYKFEVKKPLKIIYMVGESGFGESGSWFTIAKNKRYVHKYTRVIS